MDRAGNGVEGMAGRIARGGKAVYGMPVGILMLDARFPRIPGDMGHAGTWPFPVLYRVVRGATPARVVLDGAAGLRAALGVQIYDVHSMLAWFHAGLRPRAW